MKEQGWDGIKCSSEAGACMSSSEMHTLAYSSLEAPPYSAPPDHLLFWNVYIVSYVFRRADIGPPIIGYSVVREKSLFIGPLSGASVHLALETFLTRDAARVIFVYVSKAVEWWTQERVFGISDVHVA